MAAEEIPDTETTLRATNNTLGLLSKMASLIVGLTFLAYIIGWGYSSAYYDSLGAKWATSMLIPKQIIQSSVFIIFIIAMTVFYSVLGLVLKMLNGKKLRNHSFFWAILSILSCFIPLMLQNYVNAIFLATVTMFGGYFLVIAVGFFIGELISSHAEYNNQWGSNEVYLVCMIIIWGVVWAPNLIGKANATIDENSNYSFPKVRLQENEIDSWRLIGPCGDKLLLISYGKDRQERKFRLVNAESLIEIASPATMKKKLTKSH